jgi:hypothetical protein
MEKIAKEVAEVEFLRFADCMDLDIDLASMDEDDKKEFEKQKDRIISSIQNGNLVINENGEPVFTPKRSGESKPITFFEPSGATLMAMDRKKKAEDIGKMYALMGDMTKTDSSTFSKMKMGDLKICLAITTIFLG